jgi:spoVA protein
MIVFASGGAFCVGAQLLIIKTKLTPARILVIFLIAGIVLQALGIYEPIASILRSGIAIPITGFGAALAKGAIEWAAEYGPLGAFAGGLVNTAYGVGIAVTASYIVSVVFKPKAK